MRGAAHGDPAALAALFDAHGAGVYAFCHRLLGAGEPAADATQDAFLAAAELAAEPGYEPTRFRETLLSTARTASLELLGSRGGGGRVGGTLSSATMRLRPQQRAALALVGPAGLDYAAAARILDVHPGAVAALLARARLRLRDEMRGTAVAAAAVRSPACEEALPLLAAAVDGELDATEAGWLAEHVAGCENCPRTEVAMGAAAATYAAWSAAAPPSWLQASTLAEFESDHAVMAATTGAAPTPAAGAAGQRAERAGAAAVSGLWRPGIGTAALGGALVFVAFALLVAVAARPLRDGAGPNGGSVGAPGGSQTVEVADAPAPAVPDAGASGRATRAAAARAAARARSRAARADALARAASAHSAASTRTTTRRRAATAPRRSPVTPRRRANTPAARRPARRVGPRRPRRTTTTSAPAPAPAPAPPGTADEPAATVASAPPAIAAAPATSPRPAESISPVPSVVTRPAPSPKGRACGHGGCGAPPRCSPNGNCHKDEDRRED